MEGALDQKVHTSPMRGLLPKLVLHTLSGAECSYTGETKDDTSGQAARHLVTPRLSVLESWDAGT